MIPVVARWFHRLPLAWKLNAITMFVGGASMALACGIFAVYDAVASGQRMARELQALASVVAAGAGDALARDDAAAAQAAVDTAAVDEDVASAEIRLPDGRLFSRFERPGATSLTAIQIDPASRLVALPWRLLTADALGLSRPIERDGRAVGTVVIASRVEAARTRAAAFLKIIAVVLLLTFAIALVLSIRMQALVSLPIADLTSTARAVMREHRYDVRARKDSEDEIGQLIDSFNGMMDEIEKGARRFVAQQEELERRVDERTAELRTVNAELIAAHQRTLEATRGKSGFLANAGDEVRMPVKRIIDLTTLTLDTGLAPEQRDQLMAIRSAAESLLAMLDDASGLSSAV